MEYAVSVAGMVTPRRISKRGNPNSLGSCGKMRQPRILIKKGPCCWRYTKRAGQNVKKHYKRLKSKFTRRFFRDSMIE